MQAPNRSIFLHPPEPARETGLNQETKKTLETAGKLLQKAFPPDIQARKRNSLLLTEATCSAAIENEHRAPRIEKHRRALASYMMSPVTTESLLRLHHRMMEGQPHAQPGRYRSVGVTVGRYQPPAPSLVPPLMEELLGYAGERGHNPIVQAAWAHMEFETVHPFADGNGRTGRAIINQLLGIPIPISRYIVQNRQEYYRLLDSGEWEEYLDWFLQGVIQESLNQKEQK